MLSAKAPQLRVYSAKEVAAHSSRDDCWVVVRGKVYDVTAWAPSHPGGAVIYTYAGKDATDVFSAFHAPASWLLLRELCVGECPDAPADTLLADFRALRAQMTAERLFESSKLFYAWKAASTFALCVGALAVLRASDSWAAVLAAATLMGTFFQQSGWLAHDFLHHQVFRSRALNNAAGLVVGNLWQGFSVAWWKDKHNTHHAAPNMMHEDATRTPVDPDIDTLPLLAWSAEMLPALTTPTQRRLVRHQHWLLFPILFVARISWLAQSIAFPLDRTLRVPARRMELGLLLAHHAAMAGAAFSLLPPLKAAAFALGSQLVCGLLLGFVFVQSHNGMEVYSDARSFMHAQLTSTRNIHGSLFVDWFTGGLNRQIEHHLFPTLPRHNLARAQRLVRELCSKHGLYYEECSLGYGTARVLGRLREVARLA